MIRAENIKYSYNEKTAINNVSLEIQKGEFVAIVGSNGSGKSTLSKLLSGIILPKKGSILIDEKNTRNKEESKNIRKKIGIVFQNPENQLVFTTIYDDMKFMLENFNVEKQEIDKRIEDALKSVGMAEFKNQNIYDLSMGQKQRIAIAEMLSLKSEYLILDEPTAMLDPLAKKEFIKIIKKLNKENGITIIYTTNIIEEVLYTDRIIALKEGEIAFECVPKQIIEKIEDFKNIDLAIPTIIEMVDKLNQEGFNLHPENFELDGVIKALTNRR